jgi:hypothetical protein
VAFDSAMCAAENVKNRGFFLDISIMLNIFMYVCYVAQMSNLIKTAIELKDAIERVQSHYDPIGSSITAILKWKRENDIKLTEKWARYNSMNDALESFWDNLKIYNNFCCKETKDELDDMWLKINLDSFKSDKKLSEYTAEEFLTLYESSETAMAGFGDVKELKTSYDPSIRIGKEITSDKFEVDPLMLKRFQESWEESNMIPKKTKLKPHKINFYGPNSFFSWHKDTPDTEMLGTVIVGLYDSSNDDAKLEVATSKDKISSWNRSSLGNWCMFYTDLPHQVTRVTSGLRVTLSFKVFVDDVDVFDDIDAHKRRKIKVKEKENVELFLKLAKNSGKDAIGIILSHDYSISSNFLKGKDEIFKRLLGPFVKIHLMPIQVVEDGHHDYDELGEYTSNVYPMSEEHLEFLMEKKTEEPILPFETSNIPFFELESGSLWDSREQRACAHTGNESQPGSKNSIYINVALIIYDIIFQQHS